jgi:hypothetical protein
MNCRRETVKMGVSPGNRAQRRRWRRLQDLGPETYLNSTSQGVRAADAGKDIYELRLFNNSVFERVEAVT